MKKFLLFIFTMTFCSFAYADIGLYTTESLVPKKSDDIPKLVREFIKDNPERNILFYVHGRKKTLEEEWRNINEIEKVYNLKVIMLHWDSWASVISRPVGNAKNASQILSDSLIQFNNLKKNESSLFEGRKMFLLLHSMGNIVFKNYIEKFNIASLDKNLFDTVILSGSDTPFKKHSKWLSKASISNRIFVVMNQYDSVLLASTVLDYTGLNLTDDRLGLGIGIDNLVFFDNNTAKNATYFDLSRISGTEHRHYLSDRPEVRGLFHYMFMEGSQTIEIPYKKRGNLYRF